MTTLPPRNAPAAYSQGWRAAQRGESRETNPFSKRRYRHQWAEGFAHGLKDMPRES